MGQDGKVLRQGPYREVGGKVFWGGSSTMSDYMIYPFQVRHSGMDCRNPWHWNPHPGENDVIANNLTK